MNAETPNPAAARFGSRKWLLCLLVIAVAIGTRAANWIDGAQFVALLTWTIGLYMAGNVGSAAADKININKG